MEKIKASCCCGATIEVESSYFPHLSTQLERFEANHKDHPFLVLPPITENPTTVPTWDVPVQDSIKAVIQELQRLVQLDTVTGPVGLRLLYVTNELQLALKSLEQTAVQDATSTPLISANQGSNSSAQDQDPVGFGSTHPHGELWIDDAGEAHFLCHTVGDDFAYTKKAIEKFIAVLQRQIDNEELCPLRTSDSSRA